MGTLHQRPSVTYFGIVLHHSTTTTIRIDHHSSASNVLRTFKLEIIHVSSKWRNSEEHASDATVSSSCRPPQHPSKTITNAPRKGRHPPNIRSSSNPPSAHVPTARPTSPTERAPFRFSNFPANSATPSTNTPVQRCRPSDAPRTKGV